MHLLCYYYLCGTKKKLNNVLMQIVEQPDIFLREPTSEVKFPLSPEDKVIIDQMIDTMYRNNGVGLAANQVGYARRMFVMDTTSSQAGAMIFINPVIEKLAKEKLTEEEGCLSCPKQLVEVRRPIYVGLKYFCRHGDCLLYTSPSPRD